ncbi:MAG: hypothetical protein JWL61_3315 [Gemmatimonadetes bacterium]|nr:hypothetical protein [Gemmatimonadota bacterium]
MDHRSLIAYRTAGPPMRLVPAAVSRPWMNSTRDQFAQRCLPLLIANQAGWSILNSHHVRATWRGGEDLASLEIEYLSGAPPFPAASHFGHGILTWTIPYLFRTPPGYNLLARGPANFPVDGAYPLEGIVETDWSMATFTMNWQLTCADVPVEFDVDQPICMIIPQRRGELESFRPEVRDIQNQPDVHSAYLEWSRSRDSFLERQRAGFDDGWQRHYFQGTWPGGPRSSEHQTKLTLGEFEDSRDERPARTESSPLK